MQKGVLAKIIAPVNDYRLILLCVMLVCCMGFSQRVSAQELDTATIERIDAHVLQLMDAYNIAGVAVGIVQDDNVVYLQGYGVADDSGRAITPQTPFVLASVSKSFTGLAIMQLVEAGQLNLESPVADVLDWFPYSDITVGHLLYQTSGFTTLSGRAYLINDLHDVDALESTMRRITAEYPPVTNAGETFAYSNTNYDLLGLIVQVVSGQSYEDYIETNIFEPLDMQHSYTSLEAAQNDGLAQGHSLFFGSRQTVATVRSRGHIASAGLIASAEDMTHYHLALLNGGQYGRNSILSAEGVNMLFTPGHMVNLWNGYGMGWWRYPFWLLIEDEGIYSASQPYILTHDGGWHNYRTFQWLLPAKKQGIVVLANSNNPSIESLYYNLPHGIAQIINGIDTLEYQPIQEDFLTQNIRSILLVIVVIWTIMAVIAIWWLWRLWQNPTKRTNRLLMLATFLIPPLLDAVLVVFLLRLPEQNQTTFRMVLAFFPDIRLLFITIMVLAVGWGALRTLLYSLLLMVIVRHSTSNS